MKQLWFHLLRESVIVKLNKRIKSEAKFKCNRGAIIEKHVLKREQKQPLEMNADLATSDMLKMLGNGVNQIK